jgi:hypothetical protein
MSDQAIRVGRWVLLIGALLGVGVFAWHYAHGMTTAHYDAKAHLVVARRVVDSLDPGYIQLGSHWLPLTHLLYLPFVAFDAQYRTGLLPGLLSVIAFALSGWLVFRISFRALGSIQAAVFAAAILFANPNLQYIASCPLTEPLFMVLMLAAMERLVVWRSAGCRGEPWVAAAWLSLASLCRYEGWYLLAGAGGLLVLDAWTKRIPCKKAVQAVATFGVVFGVPVVAHFGYLWVRTRDSFLVRVVEGNAAPFESYKRPLLSLGYHIEELAQIATVLPLIAGLAGTILALRRFRKEAALWALFLLWIPSLINVSALYWGMIYRVRYSVILVPAIALFGGVVTTSAAASRRMMTLLTFVCLALPWLPHALPQEWKYHLFHAGPGIIALPVLGVLLFLVGRATRESGWVMLALCAAAGQVPALSGENRAILVETYEHDFFEDQRRAVLNLLKREYDGTPILIDMGKSAPLVYDSGLPIRSFVFNEVDLTRWHRAAENPASVVGWICAMKGDDLWARLQVDPGWAGGYALALQTEYFRIYRIEPEKRNALRPARLRR